ncbi:MAG: hypothetical protein IPP98_10115 [Gemmatimonadetes bacterium]|nr:hypothetical protein [Gemmatimonadota bacterium]
MRVLQPPGDPDLALEALAADRGGKVRVEHLHGHLAFVLRVAGQEDRGQPPLAKLPLERIAIGEVGLQSFEVVSAKLEASGRRGLRAKG